METIVNGIKNLVDFLNPFNWIPNLIENIGKFFNGDVEEGTKGVFGFFSDIISNFSEILSWIGNFFSKFGEALLHLFVPDNTQKADLQEKFSSLGDLAISHLPFIASFQDALTKQDLSVSTSDMLVIQMPEFNFFGVTIPAKQFVNVQEAYEPYRQNVRTGLTYIVYALGIVYIIKYIVGWGQTQANNEVVKSSSKKK